MPATAARCDRAPASRRAAIRISAGVRTLTTTALARAALDDHRDGQTVAEMARLLRAAEAWATLSSASALALAAVIQLAPAYR